ncbi:MAG: pyrroloquinoline quinone biosynthesis peptide chaperone PqqD [Steroidobacteraceae bacterium]
MNEISIDAASRPAIERHFRLQWESAQNAHVLRYSEGMIRLNGSAGEIFKRCNGEATIAEIIADLEAAYATTGLSDAVTAFLVQALEKRWLRVMR